jgi:hypothetical protein
MTGSGCIAQSADATLWPQAGANTYFDKQEMVPHIQTKRLVETLRYDNNPRPEARESGMPMSNGLRTNHSPLFKPEVEMHDIKREKTLAELSKLCDAHANQIVDWKTTAYRQVTQQVASPLATAGVFKDTGYASARPSPL